MITVAEAKLLRDEVLKKTYELNEVITRATGKNLEVECEIIQINRGLWMIPPRPYIDSRVRISPLFLSEVEP